MEKIAHIWVRDEVYMTISGLEPADATFLWNKFAIEVEGSFFMPARKLGRWDGKLRFFEKTGKVFLRLLPDIEPFLVKWGYELELHDERRALPVVEGRLTQNWFRDTGKALVDLELRPYQVEAMNTALNAGSGVILAATGAGKTLMVAALCSVMEAAGLRTITIVPSSDLVEQTANTLRLCGMDVGLYSGDKKDVYHQHVIATWQALQNNPTIIADFGCLIVDEAHGAKADVIGKLITEHAKHVGYRFGVTGTLPKPETERMTIRGSLGDVLFEITAAELIKMGYLAELQIEPIEIQESVEEEFPDYAAEKAYTSRSPDRMDFIADLIIDRASKFGNTLVLVNTIKQGKELEKLIKDSVFLHGATENEVRAEWYKTFANRDDLIVIATSGIASTGISIDRVFNLMFIDAGKSFIRCIQSVGRGLRMAADKTRVHVVDVYSGLKWSKKHAKERAKHYKNASYPMLKVAKVKL